MDNRKTAPRPFFWLRKMDLVSEIFEKFPHFPQPRWGTITVHHAAGVWPSQFKEWMGIQTFLHVEPGATVEKSCQSLPLQLPQKKMVGF